MRTSDISTDIELFGYTIHDVVQIQLNAHAQVLALIDRLSALTASTESASESAEASTKASAAKDVAKHTEDIVHRHSLSASKSSSTWTEGIRAELVISLTLLWIAKHVVCLCCFLEFLLCLFVTRIAVGVIFDGHFFIGPLNLVVGSRLRHSQYFVVVSFRHFLIAYLTL